MYCNVLYGVWKIKSVQSIFWETSSEVSTWKHKKNMREFY
jgi:hypothetical protein